MTLKNNILLLLAVMSFLGTIVSTTDAQEITVRNDSIEHRVPKTMLGSKPSTVLPNLLTPINVMPIQNLPSATLFDNEKTLLNRTKTSSAYQYTNNGYMPKLIHTEPAGFLKGEYSVGGPIMTFRNGYIYGTGGRKNMIGWGTSNAASIGYTHFFSDRLMLDVNLNASKYYIPHFSNTTFGAAARMTYRVSDRMDLNVFGAYSRSMYQPKSFYNYGASVSYDMSQHFGMEMGVNRYYDPFRTKWQTVPIVTPYIKFNNGAKFGFDFGGLLKDAAEKWIFKSNSNSGGIIAPPPSAGQMIKIRGGNPALPSSYLPAK
jgi:hypothetical protein